jgi:hypothetical protein
VDVDVTPPFEVTRDFRVTHRVGNLEVAERRVRKHHTETERIVGAVALHYGDVVAGTGKLHQDAEVEPRRPATDARNLHRVTAPRSRASSEKRVASGRRRI